MLEEEVGRGEDLAPLASLERLIDNSLDKVEQYLRDEHFQQTRVGNTSALFVVTWQVPWFLFVSPTSALFPFRYLCMDLQYWRMSLRVRRIYCALLLCLVKDFLSFTRSIMNSMVLWKFLGNILTITIDFSLEEVHVHLDLCWVHNASSILSSFTVFFFFFS